VLAMLIQLGVVNVLLKGSFMKIGLILGGGGEVGIAWEIGVLAALEKEAGFEPSSSHVIAGTSAGAIVGGYVAQGRAIGELAELERLGKGVPVGAGFGVDVAAAGTTPMPTISQDILYALMSTEGTLEERGARLGVLALQAPVGLDQARFVRGFREMLGTDAWPSIDFRPTAVNGESGETTLWDRHSGIGFASAVASSCAVPGVFPPVEFEGHHFIDTPRRPFSAKLIQSASLDAVIFVGLILPILANNNEQREELAQQAADGRLATVTVTGGPDISSIAADLLNHSARTRAVAIGFDDGRRAANAVRGLVRR
jgi:NTE family protein